jgi:hypothetical protein
VAPGPPSSKVPGAPTGPVLPPGEAPPSEGTAAEVGTVAAETVASGLPVVAKAEVWPVRVAAKLAAASELP